MGQELARATDAIYTEIVQASPAFERLTARDDELGTDALADLFLLVSANVQALHHAIIFLANQLEDPDPLGIAMLESLRQPLTSDDADIGPHIVEALRRAAEAAIDESGTAESE